MDSRLVNYVPLAISAVAVLATTFLVIKSGALPIPFGKKEVKRSASLKTKSSSSSSKSSTSLSKKED